MRWNRAAALVVLVGAQAVLPACSSPEGTSALCRAASSLQRTLNAKGPSSSLDSHAEATDQKLEELDVHLPADLHDEVRAVRAHFAAVYRILGETGADHAAATRRLRALGGPLAAESVERLARSTVKLATHVRKECGVELYLPGSRG